MDDDAQLIFVSAARAEQNAGDDLSRTARRRMSVFGCRDLYSKAVSALGRMPDNTLH